MNNTDAVQRFVDSSNFASVGARLPPHVTVVRHLPVTRIAAEINVHGGSRTKEATTAMLCCVARLGVCIEALSRRSMRHTPEWLVTIATRMDPSNSFLCHRRVLMALTSAL